MYPFFLLSSNLDIQPGLETKTQSPLLKENKAQDMFEDVLEVMLEPKHFPYLSAIIHAPYGRKFAVLQQHIELPKEITQVIRENSSSFEGWLEQQKNRFEVAIILMNNSPESIAIFCDNYKRKYTLLEEKGLHISRAERLELSKNANMILTACISRLNGYLKLYPRRTLNLAKDKEQIEETLNYFKKQHALLLGKVTTGVQTIFVRPEIPRLPLRDITNITKISISPHKNVGVPLPLTPLGNNNGTRV